MKSSLKFLESLQGAKKAASKDVESMGLTGEGGGSESSSEEGGFGEFGEEPGGGLELPPIESLEPEEKPTEEESPKANEPSEEETREEGEKPQ